MYLDNFEKAFNPKALQRGNNYYRRDRVVHLEEEQGKGSGEWYAHVQGTFETYEVEISILPNGTVTRYDCTCPYDWGGPCKHLAAVLFKIREQTRGVSTKVEVSSPKPKSRNTEELLELYGQLDETAQRLLKVAALLWEPTSQTKLFEVFNGAGFKYENRQVNAHSGKPRLSKLLQEGFLKEENFKYRCPPAFADALCDRYFSQDPDFAKLPMAIQRIVPLKVYWYAHEEPERYFRDMRIGRYSGKVDLFEKGMAGLIRAGRNYTWEKLVNHWLGEAFDLEKIENFPVRIRAYLLLHRLSFDTIDLNPLDSFFHYSMDKIGEFREKDRPEIARLLAQLNLLKGDPEQVRNLAKHMDETTVWAFGGIRIFLEGNAKAALEKFKVAQKHFRSRMGSNKESLRGLQGIFHILAYLNSRDSKLYRRILTHVKQVQGASRGYQEVFTSLSAVVHFLENNKPYAEQLLRKEPSKPLYRFFTYFCRFWVNDALLDVEEVRSLRQMLLERGYDWMAAELNQLLAEMGQADEGAPLPQGEPIVHILPRIEEWQNALQVLLKLGGKAKPESQAKDRIAWLVDFENDELQARHQTFGKNGWTKGRMVSYDRLDFGEVPGLTRQDRQLVKAIGYASGSKIQLRYGNREAWRHLIGHPLLFLKKSPTTAVQLVEAKPTLVAQRTDGGYRLHFNQDVFETGVQIVKESPTRYLYLEASDRVVEIARAFNGKSLTVPEKGEAQLREALAGLANLVQVQSAFEDDSLPTVEADSRPCVHLLPVGDGFHVELYVKPFHDVPPYVKPGQGETFLVATIAGERTATTRDLQSEKSNLKALRAAVPILKNRRPSGGVWRLEDGEDCLQLLLELQPLLGSEDIILEWPKGEKYRIDSVVGFDKFKMNVGDGSRWFEVSGELRVDEEKVLTLQELLALSEQQSQFVEVSPGKFLALTEEFRQRLMSINGLLAKPKKKGEAMQLHPLAAHALEGFTGMVEHLELSEQFKESQQRLEAAFAKKFRLSPKFKAKLRPYQREGFRWLHRCAEWGVGACLADDMGLGKTIQALALLTDRAKLGPALVVAPASVCRNWVAETERFAPTLLPVLFGEGDRAATMEEAGKGDIVIVTYDLMAREAELFTEKKWATVILDEAQAIKNRATRRSETAMELQADFRIAMTGTPIENHLGELWNLFQFLNPGLLGSIEGFTERFATPIEKYKDDNRQEQLRRLVQPFILRRRKDEVLKDLPKKTEVTLTVELPPNERAFYEALRRNALEKLAATAEDGQAGQQHLRILAEIMKLRRAACHPSLADANAGFKSSAKLELFAEIVDELLENGHKALIFSQFVGHLKILEAHLKKSAISYQYLDGSTPLKKRQERIEAFQAGEGELFLISLKAGGTGLNLTAADYVIHTDPWWNPAVEDQATDRAHRIGQERPVTVYRLVTQGTIEEKILELHAQKRDLADSLLTGTDVSAKLSAEDLMNLLKEGM